MSSEFIKVNSLSAATTKRQLSTLKLCDFKSQQVLESLAHVLNSDMTRARL